MVKLTLHLHIAEGEEGRRNKGEEWAGMNEHTHTGWKRDNMTLALPLHIFVTMNVLVVDQNSTLFNYLHKSHFSTWFQSVVN